MMEVSFSSQTATISNNLRKHLTNTSGLYSNPHEIVVHVSISFSLLDEPLAGRAMSKPRKKTLKIPMQGQGIEEKTLV